MTNLDLMLGVAGLPAADLIRFAKLADRKQYRAVWIPEITFGDAMIMDTVIAANTKRIKVGTGVVGIYIRLTSSSPAASFSAWARKRRGT